MGIFLRSSTPSINRDKSHSIYATAKYAMDSIARCIAKEVEDDEVCINTVTPAIIAFEMHKKFLEVYVEDSGKKNGLIQE